MSEYKEYVNSNDDFYEILGLEMGAEDSAINTAYRKASKLYHPDKVGPDDTAAAAKLQLVQRARGVLLDKDLRLLYDNGRRARQQVKAQQAAMSDKRREMVERLEKAERAGVKRKQEEHDEQHRVEQRKAEIAATYQQRLREHEAERRRDAQAAAPQTKPDVIREDTQPSDLDRAVTLRFLQDPSTAHLTEDFLIKAFSSFGEVDTAALIPKRMKAPGEKHRKDYIVGTIVFKSIIATLRAVAGFEELQQSNIKLAPIHDVSRFKSKESQTAPVQATEAATTTPQTAPSEGGKKVPKFSFSTKTNSLK